MGEPQLEKSDLIVRDASSNNMEILGKFQCIFNMKGKPGAGYAHVVKRESLLGLDWITQNEVMNHHLDKMINRVELSEEESLVSDLKTRN